MKTVLVTGFEPFGGASVNPSALVARRLDGTVIEAHRVVGVVLPCVFGDASRVLLGALRDVKPELVICVGEAGGRAELALERVAINVDDARIADNGGAKPVDRAIVPHGPVGYWSTLPIKEIVAELLAEGIPAAVSQTAGTFVCNHVFYALMHELREQPQVRAGFVHAPFLPEQAAAKPGAPSMELATIIRALELAIATALRPR